MQIDSTFEKKLNDITQQMADGFTSAFNATDAMNGAKIDPTHTVTQIGMGNDVISVTTNFVGEQADLFARTFCDALRAAGVKGKQVIKGKEHGNPQRFKIHSEKTGEESDRRVEYNLPKEAAGEFLKKLEKANKFVGLTKEALTQLYNVGLIAQNGLRTKDVGSKFFVHLGGDSEHLDYNLALLTNHQGLIAGIKSRVGAGDVLMAGPQEFDVNSRNYTNGETFVGITPEGSRAIGEAIVALRGENRQKHIEGTGPNLLQ